MSAFYRIEHGKACHIEGPEETCTCGADALPDVVTAARGITETINNKAWPTGFVPYVEALRAALARMEGTPDG